MKKIIFSLLSLLYCSIAFAQILVTIPANDPLIEYTGRIDFKDPLAPRFSYSGVSVRAAFQGKSIAVKLKDDGTQNYYNIIIDNTVETRIQTRAGLQTYPISASLADTIHEIEIYKLTEQSFGKTQFYGFMVEEGKPLVELSNRRELLIEFIGNSITCGYGNEGVNGGKFGPTTENHYLTYAGFTSRAFNARHLAVCKSGIGVYRNYGGPVEGNNDCMSNLYERIFLYDATPLYSFAQKPDLICVDLGTNDFSTGLGDSARYVSRFFQFIQSLQEKNNGADILCLMGPMLWGNDLVKVKRYLTLVADSATRWNQGKVYCFEMSAQTGSLGIGIDYHPTVAQHLKNSGELVNYISKLKGWPVTAYPMSGQISSAAEIVVSFNTPVQDLTNAFTGFKVSEENLGNIPLSRTYMDASDKSKVHLVLAKSLSPKSVIKVSYSQGSMESISKGKMQEFRQFPVTNKLTETTLTRASVDATGSKITLFFSKNVSVPAIASVVSIANTQNKSYAIKNITQATSSSLSVFLNERILKGDTILVNVSSGIFGTDKVEVTSVERMIASNLSVYTDVQEFYSLPCTVFPNPVTDRLIHYSVSGENYRLKAQIISIQGKVLLSRKLHSSQGVLDLNNVELSHGTYILRIYSPLKQYTARIIL